MTITNPAPAEIRPPEKLSDLILLAVDDARQLDRDTYRPLYLVWHKPRDRRAGWKQCKVCLGGAVIAGTLKTPPSRQVNLETPGYEEWRDSLVALDSVRRGNYRRALILLTGEDVYQKIPAGYWQGFPEPAQPDFITWCQLQEHLDRQEANAFRLSMAGL